MAHNVSRRQFLAGASLSTAALPGLALGLSPDVVANEYYALRSALAPEKKLGVALVGLGSYATNQLAPALQQSQYCRLAGIVTGTPAKAAEWKAKYNLSDNSIYDYKTFDRIADNKDIDVVYVVLPNSMHAEYTIRAARAGKHVICEKPMAITPAECQSMIDACQKAGKQLAVGYRLHYEPFTKEIIRLSREKAFGPVKFLETSFGFRIGDPSQWRMKKAMAGGGPLMDVGIYAIQASRYVTGEEPSYVTAQFSPKTEPQKFKDVEETLFWQFQFPGGAVANGTTSYTANVERLFAAYEKGFVELSPAYSYGPLKGRTSKGPLEQPVVHHQAVMLDGIGEVLLRGEKLPDHITGAEGLRDVKLMQAIYQAAETGRKIKV